MSETPSNSIRRPINFGAGPSKLPDEVLKIAQDEMFSFGETGISILELSHRSPTYDNMITETQELIKQLLNVPSNYKILFVDGGATGQFSAVPMNLMTINKTADYVNTGFWSNFASQEAENYGSINKIDAIDNSIDGLSTVTDPKCWKLDPSADYVHICTNETISGVQMLLIPEISGVPLVADMCSDLFSRTFDISKFGVVYASAHKIIGTSGVGVIIVREDLLNRTMKTTPRIMKWNLLAQTNSLLHTPPSFPIYIINKELKWIQQNGGIKAMEMNAVNRSKMIYDIIDNSNGFYFNSVSPKYRSKNNIPFFIGSNTGNNELQEMFLKGAEAQSMVQLQGHSTVGGIRVSMYNAMGIDDAKKLADFMKMFMKEHTRTT